MKIGAKVVRHGRYVTFQLAEVAVPQHLFHSAIDDPSLTSNPRVREQPGPVADIVGSCDVRHRQICVTLLCFVHACNGKSESDLGQFPSFLEMANHRQWWGAKLPAWHRIQVAGPPKGNSDHALLRVFLRQFRGSVSKHEVWIECHI